MSESAFSSSPTQSGAAQRRHLAVLFSDLVGSTALNDRMEKEDYDEMLDRLRVSYERILQRHGGLLVRAQGDGLLAIFGYPETREDDGRRAAEAALELHASVRDFHFSLLPPGTSLRLHTGIHAGQVLVSPGDQVTGLFKLSGNPPNIAARLSGEAAQDEIVVSEETLGAQANFFDTRGREVVPVKGIAEPIAVYRIVGKAPTMTRFEARRRRGLTPFVARSAEMDALRSYLEKTLAGTGQTVALCASAGLGKTRLIEQLIQEANAAGCRVLRGYCESYLSAEAMQPFLQILRTVCGVRPGMPTEQAAATARRSLAAVKALSETAQDELLQALSLAQPHGESRRPTGSETIAALRALLDALSRDTPLLLVVDDVQWADDATKLALDAVRSLPRPILLLAASRETSSDQLGAVGSADRIHLNPLSLEEAAPVIRHLLPDADPFLVAEIHRYAGGNPLFIEELCHFAAARGNRRLESVQGGAGWLNGLIESRLGRLPAEQAALVRTAAVIGNVVPAWLLERITGRREDDPLVGALADEDFLFPSGQGILRFKHVLTRNAVYETVGLHQRKSIHFAVASALVQYGPQSAPQDLYESLAYHYAAAGVPVEAARYAELAGDKALSATALDRAREQYLAALGALNRLAPFSSEIKLRWVSVAQKLGMGCVYDPLGLADGVELFEQASALARETENLDAMARTQYWLSYMCYARGLGRRAIEHGRQSLELSLRAGDERLAAQVRATLGQALTATCRYDEALRLFDAAIDTKRRHGKPGSSVAVGSAYTLACKGCLLGDRGRFSDAQACFDEALALLGATPHQVGSSVRGWIAAVYLWQGRWQEARAVAQEGARIAEQVRSRQLFAMSRALAGYATWVLERQPQALEAIREATSWIEARKGGFFTSLNYGWLVDGALELGREKDARRHGARLLLRARQGERIGEAMGCRALARAAADASDFAAAERYLSRARRSAEVRGSPHEKAKNDVTAAQVDAARGRRREALGALRRACEQFDSMAMPWYLHQARQLEADLLS